MKIPLKSINKTGKSSWKLKLKTELESLKIKAENRTGNISKIKTANGTKKYNQNVYKNYNALQHHNIMDYEAHVIQ